MYIGQECKWSGFCMNGMTKRIKQKLCWPTPLFTESFPHNQSVKYIHRPSAIYNGPKMNRTLLKYSVYFWRKNKQTNVLLLDQRYRFVVIKAQQIYLKILAFGVCVPQKKRKKPRKIDLLKKELRIHTWNDENAINSMNFLSLLTASITRALSRSMWHTKYNELYRNVFSYAKCGQ